MDPLLNPYAPGAGTQPPELAGREAILDEARLAFERIKLGRPHKSFILVGLRGVGKTVLLNRLQEDADRLGYRTALVENAEQRTLPELLVPQIRRLLLELDRVGAVLAEVKHALRVLKSFVSGIKVKMPGEIELGLDVDAEPGAADSGDLETDLTALMVALGEAARARDGAVALFVDEMQYLRPPEFAALIMAIHRVNQKRLPLVLVGAGLPQIAGLAGRSKSYAERLFDFPVVGALTPDQTMLALAEPARAEGAAFGADALEQLATVTEGYPYFIQEWGYHVWNVAAASPIGLDAIRAAEKRVLARLDEGFFRVRFERLTPAEKRYLRAMAELGSGPYRSGEVAAVYGADVMKVGTIRANLIRKGMIYSPAHGESAFTVPLFDAYLKRTLPDGGR